MVMRAKSSLGVIEGDSSLSTYMEPGRHRGYPDQMADSYHQQGQSYGSAQQRLPPFRDLINSEQGTPNGYQSTAGRPSASTPAQGRPPMPSLSQGFDNPASRYPEQSSYSSSQGQRGFDYSLGSNGVSNYPEVPSQYSGQVPSTAGYESYPTNSGLPSLGEYQDRRERMMRAPSGNGASQSPQFISENAAGFSPLPSDSDQSQYYSKRPVLYEQNSRGNTSFPAGGTGRTPSSGDFAGYGQGPYDSSNRGYASMYGEVEYSPHPANGTQQSPNYGMAADSNDPRNKRRRGNLPKQVTDILRAWFHDHLDHPYPTEEDKQMFIARTGLSISQISNWFINARRRQLPTLRNQVNQSRTAEHGRSPHSHLINDRDHYSSHESSLSPR